MAEVYAYILAYGVFGALAFVFIVVPALVLVLILAYYIVTIICCTIGWIWNEIF